MNYKVPFVEFGKSYQQHKKEIDQRIQKCLTNGDLILRDEVEKFEKNLAKRIGTKYAVATNSGTDALMLSLIAAGIGPGDEVITVSHTFIATIQVIHHVGAAPILIDVGQDGLMNEDLIKEAITKKTKAIIPVHLSGRVCNMKWINEIAKRRNLIVIEDACQAIDAAGIDHQRAGSWGLTGCFSFYPAKILGCYGDGGAIVTNNKKIADKIKLLRNHFKEGKNYFEFAWNSRMDNIQAAVLNVKLKYLAGDIERRLDIAERYQDKLINVGDLIVPYHPSNVYQEFIIRTARRDKLADYLKLAGVETLVQNTTPNHKLPGLNLEHFDLPMTDDLSLESIRLPIWPTLTDKQILCVIKRIKEFYDSVKI